MLFHYSIRNYYLYNDIADMRKGINGLCGLVFNELKREPHSGDLFIVVNRRRNTLKMLHWQGDGFAIFYKRLEKGTYELSKAGLLTGEEVLFLLQGVELKSVKKRVRYSPDFVSK